MPHIKVKPFDKEKIEEILPKSDFLTFRAKSLNGKDELYGIDLKGTTFLLHLKPDDDTYLLKYEKVTRPLKVNLLKEAIEKTAQALDLEIVGSNITIHPKKSAFASAYEKKIEDFEEITFPKERVCVEVGFGSGRHLLYQAQKHPDILFIGLEIHTPSAQQVLKQIELLGLDNIWVVNYDARLFLEMLPSNLLEKIYVHFPVPWDKKPHRRVISSQFLDVSMRTLKKGGRLELRTDSDNYFWYALETFFALKKVEVEVRKNEALEVTSKYEARWLKMEKDIYDCYVTSMEESPQKQERLDFNFNIVKYRKGREYGLPKKPLVFDGYFVHFEQIYRIGKEAMFVKASFGSFDRPEHKFIYIGEAGAHYFVSRPVKTKVNHLAHQKIVEYLIRQ